MKAEVAILSGIVALFGVAILSVLLPSKRASAQVYVLCLVICAAMFGIATVRLLDPAAYEPLVLPLGLPGVGALFHIDSLSAFFLLVINLGGALASLYGIGYGAHEHEPKRVLPFYAAFLAGMNLVIIAEDAYGFLIGWEFMSLSSWAMVISSHHEAENRRAGFVYISMASFGALTLLIAFGLLANAGGGVGFAALRAGAADTQIASIVLGLVTIGAGSKAGLAPLHVWLPLAHPAAPSHVSGLMSGVMTKVAVYAFIRFAFDLLGAPAPWWSMLIIALSGATAIIGVLQATIESDLKRLLAYSTVENIGVVFVGLGLALAFKANNVPWAAALAFSAALFHVLNHSLFKSLLFFGAGAVLVGSGERNIEKLGGLIHRMPQTAIFMLGGCMAISALPPLNGFASEWLMFQAILVSPVLPQWGLKLLIPAVGAALALSAALCAAAFIRAYGIAFLGRPRSPQAANSNEVDRWSLASMAILLALCLFAGVLPGPVLDALSPVARAMVGGKIPIQSSIDWLSVVPIDEGRSSYNGLLVFTFIALSALLSKQIIHRFASHATRRSPAWDCGFPNAAPDGQYTASSFAQPLRRVFGRQAFAAQETVDMPAPGDMRPASLRIVMRDRIWDALYEPVATVVNRIADQLNRVHYLTIRGYLSLVFAALVGLLFTVAIWA